MDSPSVHDSFESDFDKLTREVEQIDAHIERNVKRGIASYFRNDFRASVTVKVAMAHVKGINHRSILLLQHFT